MPASSHSRSDLALRIRVAPEEISYRSWPLREGDRGAWITMGVIVATTLLALWVAESLAMAALTLGSLLAVSWQTWLPTSVQIGPAGIQLSTLGRRRRIPWTSIRHYEIGRHGLLLSPDVAQNAFSPLRGLYLPWAGQRSQVLANFEFYLQSWKGARHLSSDSTDRTETALPGPM